MPVGFTPALAGLHQGYIILPSIVRKGMAAVNGNHPLAGYCIPKFVTNHAEPSESVLV